MTTLWPPPTAYKIAGIYGVVLVLQSLMSDPSYLQNVVFFFPPLLTFPPLYKTSEQSYRGLEVSESVILTAVPRAFVTKYKTHSLTLSLLPGGPLLWAISSISLRKPSVICTFWEELIKASGKCECCLFRLWLFRLVPNHLGSSRYWTHFTGNHFSWPFS